MTSRPKEDVIKIRQPQQCASDLHANSTSSTLFTRSALAEAVALPHFNFSAYHVGTDHGWPFEVLGRAIG